MRLISTLLPAIFASYLAPMISYYAWDSDMNTARALTITLVAFTYWMYGTSHTVMRYIKNYG